MLDFILHRANELEKAVLPTGFTGAEIDLRLYFGKLILAHDPFTNGVLFEEWLSSFTGKFIILNLKETGIEELAIEMINKFNPNLDYFCLDLPTPYLVKATERKIPVAIRVSEIEPLTVSKKLISNWIWLDSFSGDWSHLEEVRKSRQSISQKICLVSPELQGRWPRSHAKEFETLKEYLTDNPFDIQAICTKDWSMWLD